MRRRTFLATLPLAAAASAASSDRLWAPCPPNPHPRRTSMPATASPAPTSLRDRPHGETHGAAATAHPLATLTAIDTLRAGGSAVDAAIAANAGAGSPGTRVQRRRRRLLRDAVGSQDAQSRRPERLGPLASLAQPGNAASQVEERLHRLFRRGVGFDARRGRRLVDPAPAIWPAEMGGPVRPPRSTWPSTARLCPRPSPTTLASSYRVFTRPDNGIEEVENFKKVWAPNGHTPAEGDVFANPALAHTYRLIAAGGREGFYGGEVADTIDAYFKRIGGWLSKADLAAHHSQWVGPVSTGYRGVDVWALPPNSQGIATLQALNMLELFDLKAMGFQSVASLHTQIEAKRLAFEDRARYYADPDFAKIPIDWLVSKTYAAERAKLIRPDRILTPVHPGRGAQPQRYDLLHHRRRRWDDGVDHPVQLSRHGLGPFARWSGLHVPGSRRTVRPHAGTAQHLRPGQAPVPDDHPRLCHPQRRAVDGVRCDGRRHAAAGPGADHGQPDRSITAWACKRPAIHRVGITRAPPSRLARNSTASARCTWKPACPRRRNRAWPPSAGHSASPTAASAAIRRSERLPGRYGAASEMRKDGVALAY